MKILLFGASGLVGTALETVCASRNITCVPIGHKDLEITDPQAVEAVVAGSGADVLINSVAIVGIPVCEENPAIAFGVNSAPAAQLARLCERHRLGFVQLSTHAVFDGLKDGPYTELDEPKVMNIYAGTKYLAECFARSLCTSHYVVRLPTLFGPRRNERPGFIDKMLAQLRSGRAVRVADDRIDSPTYSIDVACALLDILERKMAPGIYHVANEGSVSYYDFIATLMTYLGGQGTVLRAKDSDFSSSAYKPLKTALASVKLAKLRPWQAALAEYVNLNLRELA